MYISILFILLFITTYYISYKIYGFTFNPIFSILGVFFAALVIFYSADFINHDLLPKTKAIYILGLSFFCIGSMVSLLLKKFRFKTNYSLNSSLTTNSVKTKEYEIYNRLIISGFVLTIVITVITIYVIVFEVGISRFLLDVFKSVRDTMTGTRIFTINELLKKMLLVFCPLEIDYILRFNRKKTICIVFLVLSLLLSISFSRVLFLYLLMVDLFAFYFNIERHELNLKRRSIVIGIVGLAIAFFNNTQELFNKVMQTSGSLMGYKLTSGQITILSYFFAPIKSSDIYVRMGLDSIPFAATFRYLYELFGVETVDYVDVPFVHIPFSFNTAVAEYYLYREGGFFWLVTASFVFGFISDRIFRDFTKNKTGDKVVTVSFLSLCLLMSIRSYMLMFLEFWIPLLVLLFVRRKLKKARYLDSIFISNQLYIGDKRND